MYVKDRASNVPLLLKANPGKSILLVKPERDELNERRQHVKSLCVNEDEFSGTTPCERYSHQRSQADLMRVLESLGLGWLVEHLPDTLAR